MDTKVCATCGKDKPCEDFYKSKKSKDGLRYQCRDCTVIERVAWREANPDKYKEQRKRGRKQAATGKPRKPTKGIKAGIDRDIRFFLNADMRAVIRYGKTIHELLGFTTRELMAHLDSQFSKGMGWDTYKIDGWHIDHCAPLSSFSYTSMQGDSFNSAWSLPNLQPLWAAENIAKGAQTKVAIAA